MIKYQSSDDLQSYVKRKRRDGLTIGFVPTMGALHEGHISLIRAAKEECDIAICSVFVNPTQFNNPSDLEKYPRNLEADSQLLESADCDVMFAPSVETIYPKNQDEFDAPDLGDMLNILEGEYRPGHFQGVMQVVSLLLDHVNPTHLYMGLKDFQQFAICSKMVELQGRPVEMRGMEIVRHDNGLAMSSRNERLSEKAREDAGIIYENLHWVKSNLENYPVKELAARAKHELKQWEGSKLEYFEIVDQQTLKPSNSKKNLIALCAIWIDDVRLIDNMIL